MKLKGSSFIYIKCVDCELVSPLFRVYLYVGDEGTIEWLGKQIPKGWIVEEEAGFCESGDAVNGFCPEHNKEG